MLLRSPLAERLELLRRSEAFANYERARSNVLRMKDEETASDAPSAYWREELQNIEYLLDASPLVVERMRQHCYHITGIWAYNYRSHKDRDRERHAKKLEALLNAAGGSELVVPEPPLLGGYGFELDIEEGRRGLFNIDTLKYLEVLIALQRAEVLPEIQTAKSRRFVWEIGAGWGGFAYQFKTLFPNTTYIISDLPELFLFAGTYLPSAFPSSTLIYHGEVPEIPWSEADFVLVPSYATDAVRPPRLDLALNMVSFQEMTSTQVESYVRHAAELETPFLYSLNRDRSLYNPELSSVTEILSRYFWPNRIQVLPVSYVKMLDGDWKAKKLRKVAASFKDDNDYKHLVGWRRIVRVA
jgi:putative sugar O-methyltransferase